MLPCFSLYKGESNENLKSVIKIRNTAQLSCKSATGLKSGQQVAVQWRNATRRHSISVKMAAPLASCTKKEQCSVIRFLWSEGVKPIKIHQRMKVQYSDACLSLQQVYEWSRKFLNGVISVTDPPRPGQAHWVVTPEAIAAVEAIVKENRHVTVHEIAAHLDVSHGSAHHIIHDVLQFLKVSARWVPHQLTAELKERRVMPARNFWNALKQKVIAF